MWRIISAILFALNMLTPAPTRADMPTRDRWQFKFRKFVIGAWWGPDATDAEMKAYREAGFNVVMIGRYMQMDDYGNAEKAVEEIDLAQKHGLGVMFDTYTKNDRPWGGKADAYEPHPVHHPATLTELKWLYDRFGAHPALVGFMIGDDQGEVSPRSKACTDFLFQHRPHLMPWLCGWIDPAKLAASNNPIANPQIYPTLYAWHLPADELARQYCATYASYSRRCRQNGIIFWPMFNVQGHWGKRGKDPDGCIPTDSLLRLPAYAALAYGAEGIWYFCYDGGCLQHLGPHATVEEVHKALTPLYPVAQKINKRIAAWGPMVLGRTCAGVFGTAFRNKAEWPFPEDLPPYGQSEDLAEPATGKLITTMDPDLIVGILAKPGKRPLAMVVDCRASKEFGVLPTRQVAVRFSNSVRTVRVLEGGKSIAVKGPVVKVKLEAGGGQMLELDGRGIEALTVRSSIYRPAVRKHVPARPVPRAADLAGAKAACLRIDVFGSNGGRYADKWIVLNGTRIARVPTTDRDEWLICTVKLSREQMGLLRRHNEVTITNEAGDAWKFRNVCLALQRSDGVWTKTSPIVQVYSSPNWEMSEGIPFSPDGVAGPLVIDI
jgi:hypothetical protein